MRDVKALFYWIICLSFLHYTFALLLIHTANVFIPVSEIK